MIIEAEVTEIKDDYNEKVRSAVIRKLNPRNVTLGNTFTNSVLEYEQIYTLLENTFKLREGKSAIIIGPRGVGKTVLVENALNDLQHKKKYDFFTIRLNGSFFKDDTAAIKEIARQLDWYLAKYNPSERETLRQATFEQKTVTNTMNVIIEILDRTRLNEDDEDIEAKSYMEIDARSKRREKTSFFIPIVFIIDEIDKYTHSAKQTLLYNLFDMAQSSSSKTGGDTAQAGSGTTISVIGLSTKTTVREQLEKRVKSRFSQRIIQINKIRELEEFCQCVYNMVYFEDKECKFDGENDPDAEFKEAKIIFNTNIKKHIFGKGELRRLIVENFYTIRDLNALRNELIVYIMNNFNELTYNHLKDYKNRNVEVMKTLSETELKILISCIRAKIRNNTYQINFDMAFDEYSKMILAERRDIQARIQVAGMSLKYNEGGYLLDRDAIQICWERLCDLGLLDRQPMSFYGSTSNVGRKKDESGRGGRAGSSSLLKGTQNGGGASFGTSANAKAAIGSAVGSITPGGVAVCGVELDDIDPEALSKHVGNATNAVSWAWLEVWKRVAQ